MNRSTDAIAASEDRSRLPFAPSDFVRFRSDPGRTGFVLLSLENGAIISVNSTADVKDRPVEYWAFTEMELV